MPNCRLSIAEWCIPKDKLKPDELYANLVKLGYEAVEMVPHERIPAAQKAGLETINLAAPGMQLGINRQEHHDEIIPAIQKAILEAAEHHVAGVIIFSGNRAGQSDSEGIENCCRAIEDILPCAEEARVTLLFEMLNTYDHKDYEADRSSFGFELARKFSSPRFKVLYDLYHMERMGEDVENDILENLSLIGHLHVASSPRRRIPAADGKIPYGRIAPRVMAAGYQGYWGMEFRTGPSAMNEIKKTADLFRNFMPQ